MSSDALPDDPETLKAMLLAERVQNERLRQIIKEMQRHRFGRRAETLPEDQMLLGLEDVEQVAAYGDTAQDFSAPEGREARARKRRGNRGALPAWRVTPDIRGRSAEERRVVRQQRSRPLADAFEQWLRARLTLISQKGKLADAIRYALSRWEGLTRFITMAASNSTTTPSSAPSARSNSTGKMPCSQAPTVVPSTGQPSLH
jgi:hypothetical protein